MMILSSSRRACGQLVQMTTNHLLRCVSTSSSTFQQATVQAKPFNDIPGPKPLPLLGNHLELSKNSHRLRAYYDDGLQMYGGIMRLRLPGVGNFVIVADPDVLEVVLRAEGKYPERDRSMTPKVKWFYEKAGHSPGFGGETGEAWRKERLIASKQTVPRNVNSYIEGLIPIYSRFSVYLRKNRNENQLIEDFADLSPKLTMEATGKFVFDADLDVLSNPTEKDKELLDHVNNLFVGLGRIMIEPPLYKVFPNKFYYFMVNAIKGCMSPGEKIATTLANKIEAGEEPSEVQGMLEQWLREKKLSKEQAVSLSAGMLVAGIHTTANQSSFLLYEMARNPEVQEKLYEEILTILGDRPPRAEDIALMPYLRGCMMESFRVKSTTGLVARILKEDAVILGYHVPAGTNLFYSTFTAGKDKKIFNKPLKFKPERWNKKDGPQQHPFALLPFGFGPRVCFGKRFAELELKLLLIEMVRNFKLKTEMEDLPTVDDLVIAPSGKVPLYFFDRK